MCGIAGWFVKPGVDWRPSKELIIDLVKGIEMRGRDATGYGTIQDDGELYVYKGPVSPWKFAMDFRAEKDCPIGPVGIVHTRGANVGDPDNNVNNHPVYYEDNDPSKAVIVVHNGTVGNLEDCYQKLGVKPMAEVDSAMIAAALGKRGAVEGLKFLSKESGGTAALAAIFGDGSLLLARDANPICVAYPVPGVMLWSSEYGAVEKLGEQTNELGLQSWHTWKLADMKYWYWSKDWKTLAKGEFRLPFAYKAPEYLHEKSAKTSQTFDHSTNTEFDKHYGFKKQEVDDPNKPRVLDKAGMDTTGKISMGPTKVPCNWAGCWKPSVYRLYWNKERWVPLCQSHTNKCEKKGHAIVLSGTHEMSRKIQSLTR